MDHRARPDRWLCAIARPGWYGSRAPGRQAVPIMNAIRIGIGGPVGSGKTALVDVLCRRLARQLNMAVITNDIFTREDADFLIRAGSLDAERVVGVETGACPHSAVRDDI